MSSDDLFGGSRPPPQPKSKTQYEPRLKDGTDLREARSGIQKFIRRGMEREAMVLAVSMAESGFFNYLMQTLSTILLEDIGPADFSLIAAVNSTISRWQEIYKEKKLRCDWKQCCAFCVLTMCRAKLKSRVCDDFANFIIAARNQGYRLDFSKYEFIFDGHTEQGRRMGRGARYWARVSSQINNRASPQDVGGDDYYEQMRRLYEREADTSEPDWEVDDLSGKPEGDI